MNTCKTCKYYFEQKYAIAEVKSGKCRYNPPSIISVKGVHVSIEKTMWPEVSQQDWCGKYEKTQ